MSVIDERGALFGVVNVVDAFTVVLLASVAGGVAVVALGDGGERSATGVAFLLLVGGVAVVSRREPPNSVTGRETTYATIELAALPDRVVSRITEGEVIAVDGADERVTVTDVHETPTVGDPEVTIRVAIDGTGRAPDRESEPVPATGDPIRVGCDLELAWDTCVVSGRITDLEAHSAALPTGETRTTVLDLRRTWTGRVCWGVTNVLFRRPISRARSSSAGRVTAAAVSYARCEILVLVSLVVLSATVTSLSIRSMFEPPSIPLLGGHLVLAGLAGLGLASNRYGRGLLERVVKYRLERWLEPPTPPRSFSDPSPRPTDVGRDVR